MTTIQAIDLLKGLEQSLDDYCELNDEGKTAFRMAIEALSSSEFPNSSDTDTISRQAAIDAIEAEKIAHGQYLTSSYVGYNMAEKVVKQLPPIQPEIVRCKDCEHGVLDDGFPHQYFCVFKGDEWNNADYFCGHAKRKEVTE